MAYTRDVIRLKTRRPSAEPIARPPVVVCEAHDNTVRWQAGERLHHLFEQSCDRFPASAAVVAGNVTLSYEALDRRANQVARYLVACGVKAGDRIGLLFDKTIETYVAMLGVLKAHAAYVPLDPSFPVERVRFILGDANIRAIVSMASFAERLAAFDVPAILLDRAQNEIDAKPNSRLPACDVARNSDQVCYIIYTSGTTGNPKGVVIEHPSICNFRRVASERYGYRPGDRIYQGMTIAF
ncbi:MAG: peptide synthetase, partial [Alphaproteobacteria bacterium]|nr:peptide synthetase [Alphaproteobacteria bacterium]